MVFAGRGRGEGVGLAAVFSPPLRSELEGVRLSCTAPPHPCVAEGRERQGERGRQKKSEWLRRASLLFLFYFFVGGDLARVRAAKRT